MDVFMMIDVDRILQAAVAAAGSCSSISSVEFEYEEEMLKQPELNPQFVSVWKYVQE